VAHHGFFGAGEGPDQAQVYGGYRLTEKIAQARLSTLYRGLHTKSGEMVAVKVLSDYAGRVADKLTLKLKKEWEGARALKLEHRNVVRTVACGKERGRYYIVMEFLAGGNLATLLQAGSPVVQGKKMEIMRQAARGLEYVHSRGIIHRDVCPRNVMLSAYGVAKLIDFGVAANKADRIRDTGERTGRPAYMAPELIRTNHFNEQTDIYAYGVSLYEVATGQRPFPSRDDAREAIAAVLNTEVAPPRHVRPSMNPRLNAVILKAMAQRVADRYPSVTALLEDLTGLSDADL
jgi:serine/threonine protein kinase